MTAFGVHSAKGVKHNLLWACHAQTCARYSATYCSARLKISLRFILAAALASVAAVAFLAAHSSSRLRFLSTDSGTEEAMAACSCPQHGWSSRRVLGEGGYWKPAAP